MQANVFRWTILTSSYSNCFSTKKIKMQNDCYALLLISAIETKFFCTILILWGSICTPEIWKLHQRKGSVFCAIFFNQSFIIIRYYNNICYYWALCSEHCVGIYISYIPTSHSSNKKKNLIFLPLTGLTDVFHLFDKAEVMF